MSGLLFSPSPQSPHHLSSSRLHPPPSTYRPTITTTTSPAPETNLLPVPSQQQNFTTNSSSRKRKADDDDLREDSRMSLSPSGSPNIPSQALPHQQQQHHQHHTAHPRSIKRARGGVVGRPLTLTRLLETLDVDQLRGVLKNICDQNPQIGAEVVKSAPRPTVGSALAVLNSYEEKMLASFPYSENGQRTSDYAFNRVRPQLYALLEALSDFTPHFLPPHESQTQISLQFLDGATELLHRLPDWSSFQNSMLKTDAYEEMGRAWISVVKEASKRAGGIQLKYDGWDKAMLKHNERSGGKLQAVIDELQTILGWAVGAQGQTPEQAATGARSDEVAQIRQELFSNTYGSNFQVRVGPW